MPSPTPSQVFRDLARMHVQAQRGQIACCDATATHCTIFAELARAEALPMSELVARLQLDKGWVSRAVDQLVNEGAVQRTPYKEDRRVVVISLTAAGRRQWRSLDTKLNGQLDRVFARLKPGDRAKVAGALQLLHAAYAEEIAAGSASAPSRLMTVSA